MSNQPEEMQMPSLPPEGKMPSVGGGAAPAKNTVNVSSVPGRKPVGAAFVPSSVQHGAKNKPPRKKRGLVFWLILLIVLVGIGGVVPVGRIPLLRNMAWMMGHSQEDTEHMSFLKALLTWADNGFVFRSSSPAEASYSFFDRNGGQSARLQGGQAVSGLFNSRDLNRTLARQGKRTEGVAGVAGPGVVGDDSSRSSVRVTGDVSAATDANASNKGSTVFFGEDPTLVQADKNQGYDSAKAGVKKNRNITGASTTEWFERQVNKASLKDIENWDPNQLGVGSASLGTLAPTGDIGKDKSVRDLNFAWLLGKAARRSNKPMVRKTLASISWNGGEVPKKVYEVNGSSGVGIDPDAVVGDLTDLHEKIKQDEECDAAAKGESEKIVNTMNSAIEAIEGLKKTFPINTCDPQTLSSWENQIGVVEQQCRTASASYNAITTACRTSGGSRQGTCSADRLRDMVSTQRETCGNLVAEQERLNQEAAAEAGSIPEPVDPSKINASEGVGNERGTGYTEESVQDDVNRQFNVTLEGKTDNTGDGFFYQAGNLTGGTSSDGDGSSSGSSGGDVGDMLNSLLDRWKKS